MFQSLVLCITSIRELKALSRRSLGGSYVIGPNGHTVDVRGYLTVTVGVVSSSHTKSLESLEECLVEGAYRLRSMSMDLL